MLFEAVASLVMTLAITIGIGFLYKKNFKPECLQTLNQMVLWFFLPALVFDAFLNAEFHNVWTITLFNIMYVAISYGMGYIVISIFKKNVAIDAQKMACALAFGNHGVFGLPLVFEILGAEGFRLGGVFIAINLMLMFLIGVPLASLQETKSKSFKKTILNPCSYAVLAGLVFKALNIQNRALLNLTSFLSKPTITLMAFLLGANFPAARFCIVSFKGFLFGLARLVLGTGSALAALFVLNITPQSALYKSLLVMGVTPVAMNMALLLIENITNTSEKSLILSVCIWSMLLWPLFVFVIFTVL